jgi:HEAT repeat protein
VRREAEFVEASRRYYLCRDNLGEFIVANIFISYDREDAEFGEVVQAKLQRAGYTTFMDTELLHAGDNWRDKIEQALRESQALVVIMTPESATSPYVTYEWAFALGAGVTVIPLELRTAVFHPRLEVMERLNFTNKARPWEKLLDTLQKTESANASSTVQVARNAPPVVRQAAAALDSLDPKQQVLAVESLEKMDHPAAREALSQALNHPSVIVRIAASFKYPDKKDPRILPGLLNVCRGDERTWEKWYPEGKCLEDIAEKVGPAATPVLLPFLHDENAWVRARTASALGRIHDARALPQLTQALMDSSSEVRFRAATALGGIRDGAAAPSLKAALNDEDDDVRAAAVEALGKLRDQSVLEELMQLLREDGPTVRKAAAGALGEIGNPGAAPALIEALHDKNILKDVIQALGVLGDASAVTELRRVLGALGEYAGEYQYTRFAAALALIRLRDYDSIPTIVAVVNKFQELGGSPPCDVVVALGDLGEKAEAALIDILKHTERGFLEKEAKDALKRIGTKAALDAVRQHPKE